MTDKINPLASFDGIDDIMKEHAKSKVTPVGRPLVKAAAVVMLMIACGATQIVMDQYRGKNDRPLSQPVRNLIFNDAKAAEPAKHVQSQTPFFSPPPIPPRINLIPGTMPTTIPPLTVAPKAAPNTPPQVERQDVSVPYMTPEFYEVAFDAIRHNTGMTDEEAEQQLDELEDIGQHCARRADPKQTCVFSMSGVTLDYQKEIFTATYERFSKDGRVDYGSRKVGAVQKGKIVNVYSGPNSQNYPVPSQGR